MATPGTEIFFCRKDLVYFLMGYNHLGAKMLILNKILV